MLWIEIGYGQAEGLVDPQTATIQKPNDTGNRMRTADQSGQRVGGPHQFGHFVRAEDDEADCFVLADTQFVEHFALGLPQVMKRAERAQYAHAVVACVVGDLRHTRAI